MHRADPKSDSLSRRWLTAGLEFVVFLLSWDLLFRLLYQTPWGRRSVFRPEGVLAYVPERRGWLLAWALALLLIAPLLRRVFGGLRSIDLGLDQGRWRDASAAAGCLVLSWMLVANIGLLLLSPATHLQLAQVDSPQDARILLLGAPLIAGLGEEVIFRGYLQGILVPLHPGWGTLCSVLAFASTHGNIVLGFSAGLSYALVYRQTRSLPAVILAHALYDLLYFGELFVLQTRPSAALPVTMLLLASVGLYPLRRRLHRLLFEGQAMLHELRTGDWHHALGALGLLLGLAGLAQILAISNVDLLRSMPTPWIALCLGLAACLLFRLRATGAGRSRTRG